MKSNITMNSDTAIVDRIGLGPDLCLVYSNINREIRLRRGTTRLSIGAHEVTPPLVQLYEDENAFIRCCPTLDVIRADNKLTDLNIQLKDKEKLHVHRLILAARIPSMYEELKEPPTRRNSVLHWPSFSLISASAFITYVYTGQLTVSEENAMELILLAREVSLSCVETWAGGYLATRAASLPASLLLFGEASEGNHWSVVSYDTETGREEVLGRMRKRFYAAYITLGEHVFSIGGWVDGQGASSRVDVFDTRERRWKLQAPLIIRRQQHAATLVNVGDSAKGDNEALIFVCGGGYNQPADCGGGWQLLRACEIFDPQQCR
ncbi:unnamed protein product [Dibothriocephalus latus]|uniref:BTB domain-containing protein n=1 Tax=Dibothriocephalus latus TaxID=60516 RepID=A0A3P7NWW6_DIBLA|nr:unnamed protein product [Dibothriocephalus latus]